MHKKSIVQAKLHCQPYVMHAPDAGHAPHAGHAPDEPGVLDALHKCTSFPTEKQIAKKIEQSHLQGEQSELCFLEAPWDAYHVEFTALDYQLPKLLQAFFNVLEKHKDFKNARKFKGVLITNKYIHELCAVRLVNNTNTDRWIQFDLQAFRTALPAPLILRAKRKLAGLHQYCSVM